MRKLLLLIYLLTIASAAQVVGPGFVDYVTSAPSGACSQGSHQQNILGSGDIYTCASGTWTKQSSGGVGGGTVTSVSFTGGLISVANPTTTPALTVAGTSGGIPYFSGAATWASSGALAANGVVLGGGAGSAPTVTSADSTTTHALFATAGAPAFRAVAAGDLPTTLTSGTAITNAALTTPTLGTPASGTLTNATGLPLSGVVSATGAIATIADGNNPLVINCALTSGTTCLTMGETTASSTAGAAEEQITTLTTSTAIPLQITQGANGPAAANAPAVLNVSAAAAGGLASASINGLVGAPITLLTGAGSAGGATTGNGGTGGAFSLTTGAGGAHGGNTANTGGIGGAFNVTLGAGTQGAATAAGGAAGNWVWTGGTGGAGGATSGTGGAGSDFLVTTGTGGAATAGSTTGRGGNYTITLGAAGATGTAGAPGQLTVSGLPFTTGTGTTNTPLEYISATGASAPTTWSAAGTMLGINSASGFTGNAIDYHLNGGNSVFSVSNSGTVTAPTTNVAGFRTQTKCAAVGTSANPSVASCAAAPAGVFSCATASAGNCTVNTSQMISANSTVLIWQDASTTTGTLLSVTCNVTVSAINPIITAKVAATSFSFSITTPSVNPDCFQYLIVN